MKLQMWACQVIERKSNFKISKFNLNKSDKRVVLGSLKKSLSNGQHYPPFEQRSQLHKFVSQLHSQTYITKIARCNIKSHNIFAAATNKCCKKQIQPLFHSSQKPTRKLAVSAFKYCDWMKVLVVSLRVGFCNGGKEPLFYFV